MNCSKFYFVMKKQLAKVGHATVCASLALFILLGVTAHAQTLVNKSWVKTTGLPDAIHWTGSSFDFEKNLIFVGNTVSAPGNANILVTKYRSDGAVAWQRTSGGSAGLNDYGVAVAVDNQNNSYIAAAMTAANGLFDFAVLKYDVNGQLQWTATWDGANHLHDIPTAISLDDVGNVIVVGSSVSFAQQSNYAIVKYNSAGIQLWATTYDHAGFHDFPTAIAKASNDNIVVTGASASAPNSWDYATLLVNGLTGQIENVNRVNVPEVGLDQPLAVARDHQNNLYITGYNEKLGNKNIQTVKLNAHFGLEWVRSFDADGMEDVAKAIGCDANGNVYLAGYSKTGQEGETFRILKYNPQGDEVWNKTYKPYTHDGARAIDIKVLPTGDIYVSGTIEKGSEKDFATIKYNSDGEMEWEKRFEGAGADEVTTLKADNNGNVYVSGISTLANNSKEYTTVKYSSEKKPLNFIRNAKGQPSYIADELIVKFAPAALKLSFINETEWTYGTVEDVLTDLAINELENVLPFPIRDNPQVRFTKIFDWMKSTDTITISRLGRRTATPTFWTTLLFTIPEGYDINSITTLLNGVFPTVEYSELDYLNRPLSVPNDSFVSYQSSLLPDAIDRNAHINIDSAWNFMTGKNYVNVGVYDFPIYWKHPDFGGTNFRNSVVKGGRDYWTLRDISLVDVPSGDHGTSVAGIIGAMRNNNQGVAGIAGGNLALRDTGVSLYSFGIVDTYRLAGQRRDTFARNSTIANAITEGVSRFGLHIQNHSWGGTNAAINGNGDVFIRNSIRYAFVNECLVVAARGNNGRPTAVYPSSYNDDWVLCVGASGRDGTFKTGRNGLPGGREWWQSSYGGNVDIIAPGSLANVYTTVPPLTADFCANGNTLYGCFNGTSSAAPHAAGTAGLMMSLHNTRRGYANNLAPEDVEFILQKYSTDIAGTIVVGDSSSGMDVPVDCSTRPDILNGWGRLNAGAALRMIDTPRYYILHPLENPILPLPANVFLNDTTIFLPEDINGVAAGNYTASRYQVSETYRITAPINTRIIDAWRRLSASKGYADIATTTTRIQNDPAATFTFTYDTSRTQVDVRATAFYYRVRVGTNLVWIPDNPALLKKFAYSIHLENKLYTKQEEIVNPITHFAAFPNPTSGMLSIDYQLNQFSPHIQLDVFDVAGRLVQTIALSPSQGDKTTVDIQDLAAGVYFIRLTANEYQAYQKIIKL
jgi:Subtilase family/Secretion system C-terminal sorting domain